mmetsp:Transcript_26497/g.48012  ORF Transcript_26497/g.48012 Transcript_26497/m.48012 type:complete len:220 (-) Transcript_26497:107-766(-)|eukprot:CAMPEP_0201640756 /NCGR_PEP_ID=MMETSP0493-20130528/22593_1 /ASSEMBLY_ACC=CAM_ASM_000838 /TAXON_ID=420259 /ORGANISM="Thalassiosira gravida, Strain GMp14c1" /LENGTH=219 /DNA_ID=CAMNT_0048114513 /DNA_START=845 /DNA_END=1504 /DNA_ORIENTATION=+
MGHDEVRGVDDGAPSGIPRGSRIRIMPGLRNNNDDDETTMRMQQQQIKESSKASGEDIIMSNHPNTIVWQQSQQPPPPYQQSQPQPPPRPRPRQLSQSLCDTVGWHAEVHSGAQDGFTNDNVYPSEWYDAPDMRKNMFHSTSGECCDSFFRGGTECKVYDRCEGGDGGGNGGGDGADGGGGSGSAGAGSVAAGGGSINDCAWHTNMTTRDGYTNDDNCE